MTTILQQEQERITLDDALLSMSTFPNGCDFRLCFYGAKVFVEYGCYGVHVNLVQGAKYRLMQWVDNAGIKERREITDCAPETIAILRARKPCEVCGGFRYKKEA